MAGLNDPYKYPIEQCDVVDKENLVLFREKRQRWLDWLKTESARTSWQRIGGESPLRSRA